MYGPNEQWELDPENDLCNNGLVRPVFSTCKNNCPGGELSLIRVICYELQPTPDYPVTNTFYCKILIILFSVNFPVVGGEAV